MLHIMPSSVLHIECGGCVMCYIECGGCLLQCGEYCVLHMEWEGIHIWCCGVCYIWSGKVYIFGVVGCATYRVGRCTYLVLWGVLHIEWEGVHIWCCGVCYI